MRILMNVSIGTMVQECQYIYATDNLTELPDDFDRAIHAKRAGICFGSEHTDEVWCVCCPDGKALVEQAAIDGFLNLSHYSVYMDEEFQERYASDYENNSAHIAQLLNEVMSSADVEVNKKEQNCQSKGQF